MDRNPISKVRTSAKRLHEPDVLSPAGLHQIGDNELVNRRSRRPLLPLFEAIINSIQAIEDAQEQNGVISIRLIRDEAAPLFESDKGSADITGFEIVDNGIGFDDNNYSAFSISDTTYKADRGGKGIGRFVWLVAFDEVEIKSIFRSGESWKERTFKFIAQGEGVVTVRR